MNTKYQMILSLANEHMASVKHRRNGQIDREDALSIAYQRADLAYELKDAGILSDSVEVSSLVYEAYKHFGENENIYYAFANNARTRFLVEDCRICKLIDENNNSILFDTFDATLKQGKATLDKLSRSLNSVSTMWASPETTSFLATISGAGEITAVRENATQTYNKYTLLVDSYRQAEAEIKSALIDFVFLRTKIEEIYRKYTMTLIDCFGDSVKAVSPEIFDFDTIEWLDVQSLLAQVKLEYDNVTDKCSTLMSEIFDSFTESVKSSTNIYRQTGNKTAGLVMAGLTMLNHYVAASEKSALLKQNFIKFQNVIKRDVVAIQGDKVRLAAIYKTINDLYIPQAKAYAEFSEKVLSSDLIKLLDAVYCTPQLKQLREERDTLLSEYREWEQQIIDIEQNIAYYKNHLDACRRTYKETEDKKNSAESRRPIKPFFLFNWLSFGALYNNYVRETYEWKQICLPVIKQFEELIVDIDMDEKDLKEQMALLKTARNEHKDIKNKLKKLNNKILSQISVDSVVQQNVARHLTALVTLLKCAKTIIESSLNDALTKSVKIGDTGNLQLSDAERKRIQLLQNNIAKLNIELLESENEEGLSIEDYEDKQIVELHNQEVERLSRLIGAIGDLVAMERQQKINDEIYAQRFASLKEQYLREIKAVDDKSLLLRDALRQVRTSDNIDDIRTGLIAMSDNDCDWTPEQMELFLKGEMELTI